MRHWRAVFVYRADENGNESMWHRCTTIYGRESMLPLDGVKVAEISHYMAGPAAARDL